MNYYLAIDIGASSGRHILGSLENGQLNLEEIYRFENGMKKKEGHLVWDTKYLFHEILEGIKKCKEINKIPKSIAIDTWAVDYVLLDENDEVIGDVYGYRDSRTKGMDEEVYKHITPERLYRFSGIQKQSFNTIYQLMADKIQRPKELEKAKTFLMLPDYFQFLLTGKKKSEYTNATSTQLVKVNTRKWNRKLMADLGIPKDMFLRLSETGQYTGKIRPAIREIVGFNANVVMCASHDTASAVMSVPEISGNGIYISSGTWSLMGVESEKVINTEKSMNENFTNEGGYEYRYRYLKNIMGLWMIQSVRHELDDKYSFAELCEMAEECKTFPSRVDVNSDEFLAPESMIDAIKEYCKKTNQQIPEQIGEIATVIYQSLAESYGQTVKEIEENTGRTYEAIYIVGGGSNAEYLNKLTANARGKTVYAGPLEATAIGNIMAQAIRDEQIENLTEARKCVMNSFQIKKYQPDNN